MSVMKDVCLRVQGARLRDSSVADAALPDDKKYSLSDLRRAYDMGFGNSSEGWNQEIHPD